MHDPESELVTTLARLQRFGMRPGLARMRAVLASLGNPQQNYPSVHIAGTNGKGSIAAMCASVLRSQGLRVGLYTSPHLSHVSERIRVDAKPVASGTLLALLDVALSSPEQLTFFEALTVAAMLYFAREAVDIAVVEVGLGGRLDATNVLLPKVSVIASLGLDHTEVLGSTLAAIAREKVGIAKAGVPMAISLPGDAGAGRVIMEHCRRLACPLTVVAGSSEDLSGLSAADSSVSAVTYRAGPKGLSCRSTSWSYSGIRLGLRGRYQAANAALAVAALTLLGDDEDLRCSEASVRRGLLKVNWPGRMESIDGVLLDCAHNAAAARSLSRELADDRVHALVFNCLRGKDTRQLWDALSSRVGPVFVPELACGDRVAAASEVARRIPGAQVCANVGEGISRARRSGLPVVVTGSTYLVGAARDWLLGHHRRQYPLADPVACGRPG